MRDLVGNPMEKRKAERFAELLETAEGGRRRHNRTAHDDELTSLIDVGQALNQLDSSTKAATAPDPDFQAALKNRLLSVAAAQGIGATAAEAEEPVAMEPAPEPPRRVANRRRLVIAAVAAIGVIGLSGVSTASGDAAPGDALYSVKRSTERAQLAMAGSDVNRGQLHLDFARVRLDEAKGVDDPQQLISVMSDMDTEMSQGMRALTTAAVDRQDDAIFDTIDAFLSQQRPELSRLAEPITAQAQQVATSSLDLIDKSQQRSTELRNSLMCTGTATVNSDELGPVPQQCTALPGTGKGEKVEPSPEQSPEATRSDRGGHSPSNDSSAESSPLNSPSPDSHSPSSPAPSDQPSNGKSDDKGGVLDHLEDLFSGLVGK